MANTPTSLQSFCTEHLETDSPHSPETQYLLLLEALTKLFLDEDVTEILLAIIQSDEPYNPVTTSDVNMLPLFRFFEKLLEGNLDWTLIKEKVRKHHEQLLQQTRIQDKDRKNSKKVIVITPQPEKGAYLGGRFIPTPRKEPTYDHRFNTWWSPSWIKLEKDPYFAAAVSGQHLGLVDLQTVTRQELNRGTGSNKISAATQPLPLKFKGVPYLVLGVHSLQAQRNETNGRTSGVELYSFRKEHPKKPLTSWELGGAYFTGEPVRISDSEKGFPRFLFSISNEFNPNADNHRQTRSTSHFAEINLGHKTPRFLESSQRITRILQFISTKEGDFFLVQTEGASFALMSYPNMEVTALSELKGTVPTLYEDANGKLQILQGYLNRPPIIQFQGRTLGGVNPTQNRSDLRRLRLVDLDTNEVYSEFDLPKDFTEDLYERAGIQIFSHENELFAFYLTNDLTRGQTIHDTLTSPIGTSTFRFHVVSISKPEFRISVNLPSYNSESSEISVVPTQDGFTVFYVKSGFFILVHPIQIKIH